MSDWEILLALLTVEVWWRELVCRISCYVSSSFLPTTRRSLRCLAVNLKTPIGLTRAMYPASRSCGRR